MYHWDMDLKNYRKEAIRAARDLLYPDKVVEKIRNAKSQAEICNILTSARRNQD